MSPARAPRQPGCPLPSGASVVRGMALGGGRPGQDKAVAKQVQCSSGMDGLTMLQNGDIVWSWQDLNMTEIPARLSIVTLGVRDMDVLRSFYRRLGWPELPIGDNSWTGFLLGGVLLSLFPLSDLTAEAAPDSSAPTGWSGVTFACTVGTRDEVDSAFDAAVTAGATPVGAATDRSWGGRSAFIADPEGNRWEITWSPRATYDARGALLSWG
jgi:uncharacterized protein